MTPSTSMYSLYSSFSSFSLFCSGSGTSSRPPGGAWACVWGLACCYPLDRILGSSCAGHPVSAPACWSVSQCIGLLVGRSVSLSVSQPVSQSACQSVSLSVCQSGYQPVSQSTIQSVSQSSSSISK